MIPQHIEIWCLHGKGKKGKAEKNDWDILPTWAVFKLGQLSTWTVTPFKMQPGGTLTSMIYFLELEIRLYSKNK